MLKLISYLLQDETLLALITAYFMQS